MSTYLIFNQLHIVHPQFRPKSRTCVLEPPQNFLSSEKVSIESLLLIEKSRVESLLLKEYSRVESLIKNKETCRIIARKPIRDGFSMPKKPQRTVAQEDYLAIELFSKVQQKPSRMVLSHFNFTMLSLKMLLWSNNIAFRPEFSVSRYNPANANFRVESPLYQHSRECSRAIKSPTIDLVLFARNSVGPQMQQPPRGGTWVGSTCDLSKFYRMQVLPSEWLHIIF
ncbi:neurotrimin-like isoform X2 [Vespula squamosa]|uniref:Neurotrimin-like isoform X2 n=1 Tax=Vespula squamosa TaxID=30214 RepID=A0ABD2B2M5_VESSQ